MDVRSLDYSTPDFIGTRTENQMEKKLENEMETLSPFKEYIGMLPQ